MQDGKLWQTGGQQFPPRPVETNSLNLIGFLHQAVSFQMAINWQSLFIHKQAGPMSAFRGTQVHVKDPNPNQDPTNVSGMREGQFSEFRGQVTGFAYVVVKQLMIRDVAQSRERDPFSNYWTLHLQTSILVV
jgi:hypothetical protein